MIFPTLDKYQLAIQNPKNAFSDPELQRCKVDVDRRGLPRCETGSFAIVYHLYDVQHWAVRCFYREIGELKSRYDVISSFLERHADGTFVKASLQQEGIRIEGKCYPILVMPWIAGDTLDVYIDKNISHASAVAWLPDAFVKVVERLQSLRVVHGDLQHGNIMVENHSLTLIDYDGIYLPQLSGIPMSILGHLNYMHPQRAALRQPHNVDRFPSIVIYTALKAVTVSPELWKKYSQDESLMFQKSDFVDPLSSHVLDGMKAIPELRELAERFHDVCLLDVNQVPQLTGSISGFLSPNYVLPKPRRSKAEAKPVLYVTPYDVMLQPEVPKHVTWFDRAGKKIEDKADGFLAFMERLADAGDKFVGRPVPPSRPTGIVKCVWCGQQNNQMSQACSRCGFLLPRIPPHSARRQPQHFCRHCGESVQSEWTFCKKCGVRL